MTRASCFSISRSENTSPPAVAATTRSRTAYERETNHRRADQRDPARRSLPSQRRQSAADAPLLLSCRRLQSLRRRQGEDARGDRAGLRSDALDRAHTFGRSAAEQIAMSTAGVIVIL